MLYAEQIVTIFGFFNSSNLILSISHVPFTHILHFCIFANCDIILYNHEFTELNELIQDASDLIFGALREWGAFSVKKRGLFEQA